MPRARQRYARGWAISKVERAQNRYAAAEAASASAAARERGVDPAEVAELSVATARAQAASIHDLAHVLAREGLWRPDEGRETGPA